MKQQPLAIVTGAGRGIGKAVALALADLGYNILVNYCANESAAMQTADLIMAKDVDCEVFRADIADAQCRQNLVAFAKNRFGRCDLLVNNAGVAPKCRTDILEASEESFDWVMSVNLKGPYFLTQAVAKWMIRQTKKHPERKYRICNIGSISAYASSTSRGDYCVSKAGLSMMTMLYADRLAEYGIGVFEIRPGITQTDMTSKVTEKYDRLIAEGITPIKRWGQPEDVALAVQAIAEGRMDFSTGQVINVDGGFHLRRL